MIFAIFIFLVAICISTISAWYSIIGLTAIFAAAVLPITIMGAALEVGKITATLWLHRHWKESGFVFKLYLIPAIIVLMSITSMGIYGFLSKAHVDQTAESGDNTLKIELINNQITRAEKQITDADTVVAQLDQAVQKLTDYARIRGRTGAIAVRKAQKKERAELSATIASSQDKIAKLQDTRLVLASAQNHMEAEVGPVKYIAALIYGDNPDKNLLERSVRYVIILLVTVFDPLALVLLLAADQSFLWYRKKKKLKVAADKKETPKPAEPEINITSESFTLPNISKPHKEPTVTIEPEINIKPDLDIVAPEFTITTESFAPTNLTERLHSEEKDAILKIDKNKLSIKHNATTYDFDLTEKDYGDVFPVAPQEKDMFLRTDAKPHKLFVWHNKWTEVGRTSTDKYLRNKSYIEYLIEQVESGEYNIDLLTLGEQNQIIRYLNETKEKPANNPTESS